MKKLIYLLTIIALTSCESLVKKVHVPETEPKLVVHCFLSPESPFTEVRVSWSAPLFNSTTRVKIEPFAHVELGDGNRSIVLPYDNSKQEYIIDSALFPIKENYTYFLKINAPDGTKATATCTVPGLADTASFSVSFDTAIVNHGDESEIIYIQNTSLRDIPGQTNYYRVLSDITLLNSLTGSLESGPFVFTPAKGFSDDQNRNGELIIMDRGEFKRNFRKTNPFLLRFIETNILHCDEHYYRYHYSISGYNNTNPFAEPIFVYSNMQGGLGCFGAYRRYLVQQ